MRRFIISSLFVGILLLPALVPSPAGAVSGDAACTTNAYGRNYALNASAIWSAFTKEWTVRLLKWEYLSSDPNDEAETRKNNIVIDLKYPNGTLVYSYVSPDDQQYATPYIKDLTTGSPSVLRTEGARLTYYAAFDRPGNPDPHCTAVIHLDGPNGVCLTCPVEG